MQHDVDTHHEHANDGQLAGSISNAVVHVLGEYTGRGPTKARTYLNTDAVTVVVEDALTKSERRLASDGNAPVVLQTRVAFQQMMRRDLVASVEDLTGRKVRAFMSADHIDPDVGVETFILARLEGSRVMNPAVDDRAPPLSNEPRQDRAPEGSSADDRMRRPLVEATSQAKSLRRYVGVHAAQRAVALARARGFRSAHPSRHQMPDGLRYTDSGFPLAFRQPGLTSRVRRLLHPFQPPDAGDSHV